VNDLLDASNTNLRIREDPSEGYYVAGLKTMRVAQLEDVSKIIALGERNRHYRQTDIHDHSSRSHTIFRILLENRSKEGKKVAESEDIGELDKELHISYGTKYSVLNLVDLAGSERLSESGMSSIEETQHINKSLFVLANVIYKLSDTSTTHIPYRDSKLTQILRSALGGNSLTSLICTLSPNVEHMNLSFSTLRFATRAKNVENKARINEVIDDHKLLMVYKKKVALLEKRVM
jgi:centromeric protein E